MKSLLNELITHQTVCRCRFQVFDIWVFIVGTGNFAECSKLVEGAYQQTGDCYDFPSRCSVNSAYVPSWKSVKHLYLLGAFSPVMAGLGDAEGQKRNAPISGTAKKVAEMYRELGTSFCDTHPFSDQIAVKYISSKTKNFRFKKKSVARHIFFFILHFNFHSTLFCFLPRLFIIFDILIQKISRVRCQCQFCVW